MQQAPDSAEAVACVGYAQHRLGDDDAAIASLRRSLQLDSDHAEARIYLANILYDQGEYEAALYHFERTKPDDHWDELGIWRLIELKRSLYRLDENDPELKPWDERLSELAGDLDDVDTMLMELDAARRRGYCTGRRERLEASSSSSARCSARSRSRRQDRSTRSSCPDGAEFDGSWEEIVRRMRDETGNPADSMQEFMSWRVAAWVPPDRHSHSDPRRGELHPRQRRSGAAPDRSVTTPAQREARAALDAARPAVARLDSLRGTEDLAADLIEIWNAVEAALRTLVGTTRSADSRSFAKRASAS